MFKDAVEFHEVFPSYHAIDKIPTTAQHNVPSWAVFAMFFIIIPLTSSMIVEEANQWNGQDCHESFFL
jgi:ABC-2 type transport system permease protein